MTTTFTGKENGLDICSPYDLRLLKELARAQLLEAALGNKPSRDISDKLTLLSSLPVGIVRMPQPDSLRQTYAPILSIISRPSGFDTLGDVKTELTDYLNSTRNSRPIHPLEVTVLVNGIYTGAPLDVLSALRRKVQPYYSTTAGIALAGFTYPVDLKQVISEDRS